MLNELFLFPLAAAAAAAYPTLPQMTTGMSSKRLMRTGEAVKGDGISTSARCVIVLVLVAVVLSVHRVVFY